MGLAWSVPLVAGASAASVDAAAAGAAVAPALAVQPSAVVNLVSAVQQPVAEGAAAARSEQVSLQQLVDQTPRGAALRLSDGLYAGPVKVDKPLHIIAEGNVVVRNESGEPAMSITAEDVRLQGLRIEQSGAGQQAAVLVTGSRARLLDLDIETEGNGIVLRDSERHVLERLSIVRKQASGQEQMPMSERGNGIDLFEVHDSRILNNAISQMNDGIYLESSHNNIIEGNQIEHSRYGIHCMYTDGTVISGNQGAYNVTGAMVMGVHDAVVESNTFVKQSESVNSQGLLFFDVHTSRIHGNKAEGNRVGLYVEQSNRNVFTDNEVIRNFIGVQFLESEGNQFTGNQFMGNVIEAEASDSRDNTFQGNYWEAFRGIDVDRDGTSDTAYVINPFFQRLTTAIPAYQLFFQSPGMQFMESLNRAGLEEWTKDTAPRMRPDSRNVDREQGQAAAGATGVLWGSLAMLVLSLLLIRYAGGQRQ
ncbi:nitrous oxide reductase family maturation protein NosD [Paenibacillus sp. YYML68]|uniref:right-handed parallel beta-helix repeat-containing protein n=1 Tax=Paenibacillus sp. YYML68 TaxID=2909250 RepID=UPI00249349E1|nr:NosD domain-containing protein [Paenibacillus sp. YYML68]